MLVIVDYGLGNLGSIANMLRKIGVSSMVTSNASDIANADKIILPGVGAFDNGMTKLQSLDLIGILNYKVNKDHVPILGICLGMQLMTHSSDEGQLCGLCWVKGRVVKFNFEESDLKVPHMGWNNICLKKTESKLFTDMYDEPRFYFVHSYYVECEDKKDVLSETTYGSPFVSAIEHENIFGVQFHPEKSHKYGMRLLENFCKI